MQPSFRVLSLVILTALGSCSPRPAEAGMPGTPKPPDLSNRRIGAPQALHYGWKAGQTYLYSVSIQADEADAVEVTSGNVVYTVRAVDANSMTLTSRGTLYPHRIPKAGDFRSVPIFPLHHFGFGGPRLGSPFGSANELKVDEEGHILSAQEGSNLPRALGDLNTLVIEPLSEADHWEAGADCVIVLEQMVPLTPHSHFGRTVTSNLPATERTAYTRGNALGSLVTIHKHYELDTNEKLGEEPRTAMRGDGDITFDTAANVPKAADTGGSRRQAAGNLSSIGTPADR